jgi:uncharacterized protein YjbI with pentapeptide repeats
VARRYGAAGLTALAVLVLFVGLPLLVVKGPYLLDSKHIDTGELSKGTGSAALVTGLRTALVACVAAMGAGVALLYTVRTYRLTRRGQVTDRFTKALERLGSDHVYVRIGGILALEQIIQDAPEQATDAAHVLGHFIRERAPRIPKKTDDDDSALSFPSIPAADVQSALTALTRHESRIHVDPREVLDLSDMFLAGARLNSADFTGAVLRGADFSGADLTEANLAEANLRRVNFSTARLSKSNLTRAVFVGADLEDADFFGADFTGANMNAVKGRSAFFTESKMTGVRLRRAELIDADLERSDLSGAHLQGADLSGADLTGANLSDADIRQADLTGADLREANLTGVLNLTRRQVESASTAGALLPSLPPAVASQAEG